MHEQTSEALGNREERFVGLTAPANQSRMENTDNPAARKIYESPYGLVGIIALSIFVSETFIMFLIDFMRPLISSEAIEAMIDSSSLIIMVSPTLYFFIFRPLLLQIRARRTVEETLQRSKDQLESVVEARTNELSVANERLQLELTEKKRTEAALRSAKEEIEEEVVRRTVELKETNEQLTIRARELEEIGRQTALLSKMGEFLQACHTAEEAYTVVSRSISRLLTADSGALFIFNNSRNFLDAAAVWGRRPPEAKVISPNECWALRDGRVHLTSQTSIDLLCGHVQVSDEVQAYLCVPMTAQGEMLGVLHLEIARDEAVGDDEERLRAKKRIAVSVAEQAGLAIVNLKLRESLRNLSIRDPITGLFNRRYLDESLEREEYRAARSKAPLGIMMIDIDHFKRFNDTFGHQAGDSLLRELGGFMHKNVRGSDIACRYGGEEFAIILPDADLEALHQRAEDLREGVKHINTQHDRMSLGAISISIGIAAYPRHGSTIYTVLQAADAALYTAKAEGRDRVVIAQETGGAGLRKDGVQKRQASEVGMEASDTGECRSSA